MMQLNFQVSRLLVVLLVLAALVGTTMQPLPKRNRSADNRAVLPPARKQRTGQQVASVESSAQTTRDLRRTSMQPATGGTCDTCHGCDSEMAEDGASCETSGLQPVEPVYATALL